jgi:hypothetical protein
MLWQLEQCEKQDFERQVESLTRWAKGEKARLERITADCQELEA